MPPLKHEKNYLYLLAISPIFALVIKGWIGWALLICMLAGLYLLRQRRMLAELADPANKGTDFWCAAVTLALTAPVLAVFIGQAMRQEWSLAAYDSPLKFAFAIPIFLLVYRQSLPLAKAWQFTMPAVAIATALALPFLPRTGWGVDSPRLGTYFVDPLTLGLICLTVGLLSLSAINLQGRDSKRVVAFKLLGAAIGIYLSIRSGSRTGWLGLPLALLIIVYALAPVRYRWAGLAGAVLVALAASAASYQLSATVKERADQAVSEVVSYRLNETNEFNSVGGRITFIRTAWYLLTLRPFSGWGDKGFKSRLNDPEISRFSTVEAREFVLTAGFHNEFFTNGVRSGVWGLLSTALLFFVPIALFVKASRFDNQRRLASFALVYMVCILVGGMTTEVFNLKFTASLHALLIAGFCGSVLAGLKQEGKQENKS